MSKIITSLQPIGRALMLPIAVLPAAALLLRLGQPDLLNIPVMAAAGDALFKNLGLLFAVGVAVGLARENHGAAGLAALVGFLVTTKGAEVLIAVPPEVTAQLSGKAKDLVIEAYRDRELLKLSVPAGLINGLLGGWLYNRFSDIRLPSYLAFFAGRRFVPIMSGFAGIALALCFGYGFPLLERGLDATSEAVLASGSFGLFAYGLMNRVLIVTGLHHILNNIAWFLLGDYNGAIGDLHRFFAGDLTAGVFMSGFFPVMMFGLPAACLAMYHAALPERRKAVGGLLFSMALTSFLTGVTEPIEFSFMFLAPLLYGMHAVLTGVAMAFLAAIDVRLGFGFSAGLFDYVLNFNKATRPWLLLPVGLVYFALYYGVFRYFIVRFDLKTPGRELEETAAVEAGSASQGGNAWVDALGGARNLVSIDACTTRLRLVVADQAAIDEAALKRLGARGVVRPSAETLQVVVGPIADQLAADIRSHVRAAPASPSATAATAKTPPAGSAAASTPAEAPTFSAASLLEALGGRGNVRDVRLVASRICIALEDASAVIDSRIEGLEVRGIARPTRNSMHIVLGPSAAVLFEELNAIL